MPSLKIANKSFFSFNLINQNYFKHLFSKIKILKFIKKEAFSFFLSWFIFFTFSKLYHIKTKINYFTSHILFSFFTHQKLISYAININLSLINTLININNIKFNSKNIYQFKNYVGLQHYAIFNLNNLAFQLRLLLISHPNTVKYISLALRLGMAVIDPSHLADAIDESQNLVAQGQGIAQAQGAAQGQGIAQAQGIAQGQGIAQAQGIAQGQRPTHLSTPPSTPPPNEGELVCPGPPAQRTSAAMASDPLNLPILNLLPQGQEIAQGLGLHWIPDDVPMGGASGNPENASMGGAPGNPENASRGNASGNSEDNSVGNGSENSENQSMGEPESKRQRCESPSKRL
jgi:hypothetical protein